LIEELNPLFFAAEDIERAFFLANLVLMQNDLIMPEVVELELLKGGNDLFTVVALVKDTEGQHKYRIVIIDTLQAVVAAFIHIHDIFAEWARRQLRCWGLNRTCRQGLCR